MASRINVTPKKRGRPATGKQPHVSVRMEHDVIGAIERFRITEKLPSQSEAIRFLLRDQLIALGYLPAPEPGEDE